MHTNPIIRIVAIIVMTAFISSQCGIGTAFALRAKAIGETRNVAQAIGIDLEAGGTVAGGVSASATGDWVENVRKFVGQYERFVRQAKASSWAPNLDRMDAAFREKSVTKARSILEAAIKKLNEDKLVDHKIWIVTFKGTLDVALKYLPDSLEKQREMAYNVFLVIEGCREIIREVMGSNSSFDDCSNALDSAHLALIEENIDFNTVREELSKALRLSEEIKVLQPSLPSTATPEDKTRASIDYQKRMGLVDIINNSIQPMLDEVLSDIREYESVIASATGEQNVLATAQSAGEVIVGTNLKPEEAKSMLSSVIYSGKVDERSISSVDIRDVQGGTLLTFYVDKESIHTNISLVEEFFNTNSYPIDIVIKDGVLIVRPNSAQVVNALELGNPMTPEQALNMLYDREANYETHNLLMNPGIPGDAYITILALKSEGEARQAELRKSIFDCLMYAANQSEDGLVIVDKIEDDSYNFVVKPNKAKAQALGEVTEADVKQMIEALQHISEMVKQQGKNLQGIWIYSNGTYSYRMEEGGELVIFKEISFPPSVIKILKTAGLDSIFINPQLLSEKFINSFEQALLEIDDMVRELERLGPPQALDQIERVEKHGIVLVPGIVSGNGGPAAKITTASLQPATAQATGEFPSPKESGVKVIFFDVGGVLLDCDYHRASIALLDYCSTPTFESDIYRVLLSDDFMVPFESGKMSPQEYFEKLKLKIGLTEKITYERFVEIFTDIYERIPGAALIMRQLKEAGYKIFIISNTNPLHREWVLNKYSYTFEVVEKGGFIASCDSDVQEMKGDENEGRIFKVALEKAGIAGEPGKAIFIDDVEGYGQRAEKLGIKFVQVAEGLDLGQQIRQVLTPAAKAVGESV